MYGLFHFCLTVESSLIHNMYFNLKILYERLLLPNLIAECINQL